MLVRWNPFFPVKKSENAIDKFFDSFSLDHLFDNNVFGLNYLKNEDGSYSIDVDVPGIKEEDISVNLTDNIVTVKGERKTKTSTYSVNKSFSLPENCDSESLTAQLKDGVLTLTVAVKTKEEKKTKSIPILK